MKIIHYLAIVISIVLPAVVLNFSEEIFGLNLDGLSTFSRKSISKLVWPIASYIVLCLIMLPVFKYGISGGYVFSKKFFFDVIDVDIWADQDDK